MPRKVLDLMLHPVRLRIVNAFAGGDTLSTAELRARLPQVAQATMYRHVAQLVRGGLIEVEEEVPVRGVVERRYRLRVARARIDAQAGAGMTRAEHRKAFAAAVGALLMDFDAYIARPSAQPLTDRVGYRQGTVWLRPDEADDLARAVGRALAACSNNGPGKGRRPYRVSPILFPLAGDS